MKNKLRQKLSKHKVIFYLLKKLYSPINFTKRTIWYYFRKFSKNSIFLRREELSMCSLFPIKLLNEIINLYNPNSVLDVGCGVGKSLNFFLSKNIDVLGIEGSHLAISEAKNPQLILKYNLNKAVNIHKRFDLIWCFEVAEHIHPDFTDNLMQTFLNHSDTIIMSAARPGQGGEGHFNEQGDEYWSEKFIQFGYKLDKEKTKYFREVDEEYGKNIYCFCKMESKNNSN